MLGLKLNHVSKRGHRQLDELQIEQKVIVGTTLEKLCLPFTDCQLAICFHCEKYGFIYIYMKFRLNVNIRRSQREISKRENGTKPWLKQLQPHVVGLMDHIRQI